MTTNNLIFIKGGSYNEIKKALRQWIDLYSKDLQDELSFQLFKNGRGNHIILADSRLDNERFYFLINYLKYPEGIEYQVEIDGFTIGKENNLLKDKQLLVYISPNDKDFDNVFVATADGKNYKVDFGGRIIEVIEKKEYIIDDKVHLDNPEIFKISKLEYNHEQNEKSQKRIENRFRIISLITLIVYTINLLVPFNSKGIEVIDQSSWIIFMGVGIWFLTDYEMLRIDRFYIKSLFIAIGVFTYGFLLSGFIQNDILEKMIFPSSLYPMTLLIVQWPTRRLFKLVFKREPEVDNHGKFADLVYTIILFVGLAVLPFLINDWIK